MTRHHITFTYSLGRKFARNSSSEGAVTINVNVILFGLIDGRDKILHISKLKVVDSIYFHFHFHFDLFSFFYF